ncbi:MAG: glycosyl transferase family 1 [Bacteroidetes bacterium RIFCSPLOWO2_12_FULL_35_15]|nr:MAG: glycosyl transferase family 1 [Bacteroidetes bacterium RIFCSPLOWO2_12_FULL_35_15]
MSVQKQKVIIVGPAFPLRGGIANFNEALCRAMNVAGIETKIISFSLQYPNFLFPGKTQFDTGNGPQDIVVETKINSINPFNWLSVAKQIKSEQPDYVIFRYWLPFMGPCLGSIAKWIKKKTNIKVIAITDNVIPHEKRFGDSMFTNYFVKQCDGFIAMSQSVLNDLSEFTKTTNKVFLPHPIYDIFGEKVEKSVALKQLNLNSADKHILFFGFIRKYKGLDLLLEAMTDERIKQLNVKLIVAGEYYEDAAPYNEIIKKNNLENNIILKTEYIPSEEVKYYFCAADIIAQPYRNATQSGVTQIAYHFEKPMLVTNVGGLPEIVPHNKVGYVTQINSKAIADAIVDFYTNNKEEEFIKNTVVEKQRFLWSAFVKGVVGLYGKISKN